MPRSPGVCIGGSSIHLSQEKGGKASSERGSTSSPPPRSRHVTGVHRFASPANSPAGKGANENASARRAGSRAWADGMDSGESCGKGVVDDEDLAAMLHDVKKASSAYAGESDACWKDGRSGQEDGGEGGSRFVHFSACSVSPVLAPTANTIQSRPDVESWVKSDSLLHSAHGDPPSQAPLSQLLSGFSPSLDISRSSGKGSRKLKPSHRHSSPDKDAHKTREAVGKGGARDGDSNVSYTSSHQRASSPPRRKMPWTADTTYSPPKNYPFGAKDKSPKYESSGGGLVWS